MEDKRSMKPLLALVFGNLLLMGIFFVSFYNKSVQAEEAPMITEKIVISEEVQEELEEVETDLIEEMLKKRAEEIGDESGLSFGSESELNVLVLGLDARKDEGNPRCDAIHMYTLNLDDWTMKITSVPRGTYAYIPQQLAPNQYYLANACATMGIDYGVEQIEKVVGVKADYTAMVGFSQALGIFRELELPTTETLQWLRHRQSYAIGDPQRSHNQATFMKDQALANAGKFRSKLTVPLQYVLYTMVDTDMEFGTMRALLNGYLKAEIDSRPEDIVLDMKPWAPVVDLHYDPDTVSEDIDGKIAFLRPYLNKEDLSERPLEDLQSEYIGYLNEQLLTKEGVVDVVNRKLWLQVEDTKKRETFQFAFMEKYVENLLEENPDAAETYIADYILEKETLENDVWAEKGKSFLETIIE